MLAPPAHCSGCRTEREAMDDVTFRSDSVLSDVHLHTPRKRHLMVRLNAIGQPDVLIPSFLQSAQGGIHGSVPPFCHRNNPVRLLLDKNNLNSEKERDCQKENQGRQEKYAERLNAEDSADDRDTPSSPEKEGSALKGIAALLDEDGDLDVVRKPPSPKVEILYCSRDKVCPIILTKGGDVFEEEEQRDTYADTIKIEHTMATPLEDVGKQVWRGALLLADYILSRPDLFKDRVVLELGGGTGIVSIIVAKAAKTIYCTDVGEDLLDMCERNVALNKRHTEPAGSTIKVRALDWLKDEFCTDPDTSYRWSKKEIAELHSLTTVILAADVFYDDYLTAAFFKTLYRITHNLKNPCTVYLSIEKRLNFTLRHMDVACEAYSHFRKALNDLVGVKDGKMSYTVEPVQLSFPQHVVYERVEQLHFYSGPHGFGIRGESNPQIPNPWIERVHSMWNSLPQNVELWKITADVASERSGPPGD